MLIWAMVSFCSFCYCSCWVSFPNACLFFKDSHALITSLSSLAKLFIVICHNFFLKYILLRVLDFSNFDQILSIPAALPCLPLFGGPLALVSPFLGIFQKYYISRSTYRNICRKSEKSMFLKTYFYVFNFLDSLLLLTYNLA